MDLAVALDLAVRLSREAGDLARSSFSARFAYASKSLALDVVTEIDRAAERLIVGGVRRTFPGHVIIGEESGLHPGHEDWTWLVDPLDGTTNFTIGLPVYGVAIALTHRDDVVAAVVRDSHTGRYLAGSEATGLLAGDGAVLAKQGEPVAPAVALQQGYGVDRDDPALDRVRSTLEARYGRVFYTWSPAIDTMLLLAGHLCATVAVDCAGPEHVAAQFLARQAGCTVRALRGSGTTSPDIIVTAWPEAFDAVHDQVAAALVKQLPSARRQDADIPA
ncbi:inositol monophosphatase family protein [Parafrankia discariae]|uniref:inositol monophosphatase family protein n=1 Tax=Parafrankia discariae TaxID=365528 RepID=UPI0009FCEB92|nr:inositol monophosphatase [Parafrankia discariae]